MAIKILMLCFLCLLCVGLNSSSAEVASPYQKVSSSVIPVHQQVTDILGTSLEEIAGDYSPYSRIGWKIAINGIDESKADIKTECGWGYITGYDSSTGVLSGMGQMYEISPGSNAGSPVIDSLGDATLSIYVAESRVSISTGGSDPGHGTAWAALLGTYSNLQDGGNRIFYGFGNNPDYSASMCVLTFANMQGVSSGAQEDEGIGYIGPQYEFTTVTPTPAPTGKKQVNLQSPKFGPI